MLKVMLSSITWHSRKIIGFSSLIVRPALPGLRLHTDLVAGTTKTVCCTACWWVSALVFVQLPAGMWSYLSEEHKRQADLQVLIQMTSRWKQLDFKSDTGIWQNTKTNHALYLHKCSCSFWMIWCPAPLTVRPRRPEIDKSTNFK